MTEHTAIVRMSKSPKNDWGCKDCGKRGELRWMLKQGCIDPAERTSSEEALLDAIGGEET